MRKLKTKKRKAMPSNFEYRAEPFKPGPVVKLSLKHKTTMTRKDAEALVKRSLELK